MDQTLKCVPRSIGRADDDPQCARYPSRTAPLCAPCAVLSGNWQIGSISEERAGKGWFWALGVGTPFDPDKVRMHGSHVDSLDDAKRQFQIAWDKWLEWADLE